MIAAGYMRITGIYFRGIYPVLRVGFLYRITIADIFKHFLSVFLN